MPFPAVARPRLDYIRKGLNGIKVSADVSQMKICPLGLPLHKASPFFFFFFLINEQLGSKVEEPEDSTDTTLTQTSALLEKYGRTCGLCNPLRFLIMSREHFHDVTSAVKTVRPCVSLSLLLSCTSDCPLGRNGTFDRDQLC